MMSRPTYQVILVLFLSVLSAGASSERVLNNKFRKSAIKGGSKPVVVSTEKQESSNRQYKLSASGKATTSSSSSHDKSSASSAKQKKKDNDRSKKSHHKVSKSKSGKKTRDSSKANHYKLSEAATSGDQTTPAETSEDQVTNSHFRPNQSNDEQQSSMEETETDVNGSEKQGETKNPHSGRARQPQYGSNAQETVSDTENYIYNFRTKNDTASFSMNSTGFGESNNSSDGGGLLEEFIEEDLLPIGDNGIKDQYGLQVEGMEQLSSFTITYKMSERPTANDVEELDSVTTAYIRPYIYYVYDDALDSFILSKERAVFGSEGPRITFVPYVKFLEETVGAPENHVMNQLRIAFTEEHHIENYLRELQRLNTSNPFQEVTSFRFSSSFEEPIYDSSLRQQVRGSGRTAIGGGVAGAFVGAFLILGLSGYMIHGKRRRGILPGHDDVGKMFDGQTRSVAVTHKTTTTIERYRDVLRANRQSWQRQVRLDQAEDVSVITELSDEDQVLKQPSRANAQAGRLERPRLDA